MSKITLAKAASAEIEEKKSVFIGNATPVKNEDEALEFIAGMRKKYYDARHNVFAYSIGDGSVARFTDDGEPEAPEFPC